MLQEIKIEDKDKLNKLMQLYLHDISKDFKMDFISETCNYAYENLSDYYTKNDHKGYFIIHNENIAGFILYKYENLHIVQEFFVPNNYKRAGIGKNAAIKLFDMYKGNWEVKCVPNSVQAEKFWNKVIKEYTNDFYKLMHTGKYNRAEFEFFNK